MNKPLIFSSVVALGIGFSLGWLLRAPAPTATPIAPQSPEPAAKIVRADGQPQPQNTPRPPRPTGPRGAVVTLNGTAVPPESLQKKDRAKWKRLIEVLGLDTDQAKALEAALPTSRPAPDENTALDTAYIEAGEELEQKILALLTPEQQTAFREMQQRSLENHIEVKAQEEFGKSLTNLDLTEAQRDRALEVLRANAEEKAATIPTGARLILSGSPLPIGNEPMNEDSFALMGKLQLKPGETPQTFEQIAAVHRAELEKRMNQFEGILSPGQLELYQSSLTKTLENINTISPRR